MLWLVTTGGVVRIDTANLERNRIAPIPVILSLSTDKASVAGDAPGHPPIRLAPGTERLRIDYTAPSLRMPERVRFETMLEGVDTDWQDAGTRRTASYTSVKPGDYVFRLRAINEDGVRSTAEAVLPFAVEPTFRQTAWFKLLAAAALAMLLVLAYRYRVRYLTRRVTERLHVRMAERERIARTLHDTFLQTVQSLLLRVDAIAAGLPKDDSTRRQLETVLDHAGSALGEGREQLQELRSGGGEALEDLLDGTVGQLRTVHPGITIGLRTEGQRRRVRPEVAGEAAAIAREALHNACIHAAAGQVRAVLAYAAGSLALSVSDDGRGIDGEVLRKGAADGRWGLVGMRERAQRIGAALEIAEGSEGGTVVRLTVPAARAYAD
jgi:signal transduction histidine kinase